MERFAKKIVQKCIQTNLIEEDQSDWLLYSLQRRIYEHWRLSVLILLCSSYTPSRQVLLLNLVSIFGGKDKWAAHANEVVLLCILADL